MSVTIRPIRPVLMYCVVRGVWRGVPNSVIRVSVSFRRLGRFRLQRVYCFLAIIRSNGGFDRTTGHLNVGRPPLDREVRTLRTLLDANRGRLSIGLFSHDGHPVRLARTKRTFLIRIRRTLARLSQTVSRTQRTDRNRVKQLVVNVGGSVTGAVLPRVIRRFRYHFPGMRLRLHRITLRRRFGVLEGRRVSIVFRQSSNFRRACPKLGIRPVLRRCFIITLPVGRTLTGRTGVSLGTLRGSRVVLPSLSILPFCRGIIALYQRTNFRPGVGRAIATAKIITLLDLITTNVNMSVLPGRIRALRHRNIICQSLRGTTLGQRVTII